jgi:hypothetical protein
MAVTERHEAQYAGRKACVLNDGRPSFAGNVTLGAAEYNPQPEQPDDLPAGASADMIALMSATLAVILYLDGKGQPVTEIDVRAAAERYGKRYNVRPDQLRSLVLLIAKFCTGQSLPERIVLVQPEYQFAKKGMWSLRFVGKDTYLEGDLRGAVFIHYLIRHQGHQVYVIRMMADVAGTERKQINAAAEGLSLASGNAGELVDEKTIQSCRNRYDSLVAEREHADGDRLAEIHKEIRQIALYLSSALGLGGKSRKALNDVTRVRKRIARVIKITIDKIEEHDPDLARHLRNSIRTNTEMSYIPDRPIDWTLE